MDALRRLAPAPRAALAAAAAVAAATIAGCVLLGGDERELVFSHRIHVQGEELECANCHENFASDDDPGMPALDTCLLCHAELDEPKPPERRIETLFEGGEFRARRVAALADEVRFSHLRHVEEGLDCGACHTDIAANERVGPELAVDMDSCVACHQKSEPAPTDCSGCHSVIDRSWPPPSHAQAWDRLHGAAAREGSDLPAASCSLCHEESTCARCHQIEQPRSHTATFRLRSHGMLARMDRESCATCHEPSACDQCHSEVRPLSHVGMWGGPKDLHCLGCHTPLPANGCFVCHKATPSHGLAPPKPDWHTPDMNCRLCHGRGLALSHVDNGENCNLCHF